MEDKRKIENEVTSWYLKVSFIVLTIATIMIAPSFSIKPGDQEAKFFETVNSLPEGSKVLIAVNYGPTARYELSGSFRLLMRELLSRNIGAVFLSLSEIGVETTSIGIKESFSQSGIKKGGVFYGRDYVNLGFMAGGTLAAATVSQSIMYGRGTDVFNNKLSDLSIMNGIMSYGDFSAFIEFSSMKIDGTPAAAIFDVFSKDRQIPVIAVVTADMVSEYLPFKDSGRIDVLIEGGRSMAALETVFESEGISTTRYSIASILMIFIIFIVILFNINSLIKDR